MYHAFFKLARCPFEMSPDPYFLYATAQHQEALAGLYYGITARKGFLVLTGEVGTGKTLVVKCLQELLDKNRVALAVVFNTLLSDQQFLECVAEELGVSPPPTSKRGLLIRLNRLLVERHRLGLTTVLVVEEAQHLSPVVLEELRLLTNLETPQGKLLQVVLVGQPELAATFASPGLRQLHQRIALWFRLRALSEEETSGYVRCRLQLAGDGNGAVFKASALECLYSYSQGIPRLINALCDNAMISAFALRNEQVTPELIEEAASDLGLERVNGNSHTTFPEVPQTLTAKPGWENESLAAVLPLRESGVGAAADLDPAPKEGNK